jgi:hypothetical protein
VHPTVMSSFLMFSFFALTAGHRETTEKLGRDDKVIKVTHVHYKTTIQCVSGTDAPADLAVFASAKDPIANDDTIAFVIARAYLPANAEAQLDAYHLAVVPGDVNDERYEDNIPNMPYPFVTGVGEVISRDKVLEDGNTHAFDVDVCEYVTDGIVHSTVQCVSTPCCISTRSSIAV